MDCLIGPSRIVIGNDCNIGKGVSLTAWDLAEISSESRDRTLIDIGSNVSIGAHNHITATNRISIGDGFLSGKWVTITDNSHGKTDYQSLNIPPQVRKVYSKGPVIVNLKK